MLSCVSLHTQVHHLERVDAHRVAQARRLVGERDLQRVEIVAAVLDHLRGADRRRMELARQMSEELAQLGDRIRMVGPDDR